MLGAREKHARGVTQVGFRKEVPDVKLKFERQEDRPESVLGRQ